METLFYYLLMCCTNSQNYHLLLENILFLTKGQKVVEMYGISYCTIHQRHHDKHETERSSNHHLCHTTQRIYTYTSVYCEGVVLQHSFSSWTALSVQETLVANYCHSTISNKLGMQPKSLQISHMSCLFPGLSNLGQSFRQPDSNHRMMKRIMERNVREASGLQFLEKGVIQKWKAAAIHSDKMGIHENKRTSNAFLFRYRFC